MPDVFTTASRPASYNSAWAGFPAMPGIRSVVVLEVERIADSCGYGVPRFEFVADRPQLTDWCEKKGAEGVREYRARKNRASIDGLPGLPSAGRG